MNAWCAVAFVVAGVFGVGDWIAKARHDRRLELVCKPLTLVALIAAAIALHPAADAHARRGWFVAALVLSLAGDVLLMLDDDEAARYWATRPRGHQLSAWASPQSRVIDGSVLEARRAQIEERFAGLEPPLPPFWGGFVVGVDELECWQGRPDRLHERVRYRRRDAETWQREQLAP